MGSVNSTKADAYVKNIQLQTLGSDTQQILQSEIYLIVRAASTAPRLSHASQQANSRAYKPRRVLQARAAFSYFLLRTRAGSLNLLQSAGEPKESAPYPRCR